MFLKLSALILFFIPHPLNAFIRKNILRQKVESGAKISIFSLIIVPNLELGRHAYVAPFTIIKCHEAILADYSHISLFTIILSPSIKGATFRLGRHSRIFPFCWLEPGEGIFIGDHVGIGGHTLIFTHGSWSDFLHSGPVAFGPVKIENHVWLPWRVFVMPNVTIGERAIIGANSTVTKSIPAHSLATGTPAKIVKEGINKELCQEEFIGRVEIILSEYVKHSQRSEKTVDLSDIKKHISFYRSHKNELASTNSVLRIDMSTYTYTQMPGENFLEIIPFLRSYGIRLEPKAAIQ
jgi:acetyltransferase-like isoleucine patch superfamily enzyme